jgi:hypothetical protein
MRYRRIFPCGVGDDAVLVVEHHPEPAVGHDLVDIAPLWSAAVPWSFLAPDGDLVLGGVTRGQSGSRSGAGLMA